MTFFCILYSMMRKHTTKRRFVRKIWRMKCKHEDYTLKAMNFYRTISQIIHMREFRNNTITYVHVCLKKCPPEEFLLYLYLSTSCGTNNMLSRKWVMWSLSFWSVIYIFWKCGIYHAKPKLTPFNSEKGLTRMASIAWWSQNQSNWDHFWWMNVI